MNQEIVNGLIHAYGMEWTKEAKALFGAKNS
jgi:hypothetical protein